jgi:hypothetical protein
MQGGATLRMQLRLNGGCREETALMKLKLDDKGNVVVQDGKPVYVHDDGKEVAFDAPNTIATISRLNGEAKTNRERYEAAEGKLKSFDGITDPEIARKALETIKNIDDKKLVDAGKVEEVRAAAVRAHEEQSRATAKAHAEEVTRLKAENEKITSNFYAEKIGGSFSRSKFFSKDADSSFKFSVPPDMVQARFGHQFKIEDGKVVAYDSAGNKIYSRTRPGEIADFDEALETLVENYPYKDQILKGSVGAGGGAGNGSGAGGKKSLSLAAFNALSPKDRAKHMEEGGTLQAS